MLPILGLTGSVAALVAAGCLVAAGWAFVWPGASRRSGPVFCLGCVCATLLAVAGLYIAFKPLDCVGIAGAAGGTGQGSGTDVIGRLTNRFYMALAFVIVAEIVVCALITALTRRASRTALREH